MAPELNWALEHDTAYLQAGNDLIMPGSQQDVDALLAAVQDGRLTRAELQACAKRVLALAKKRAEAV